MQKKVVNKNNQVKKESQKGVTIVALIVTIVILLILASVTIAYLTGDSGIINKASDSEIITQVAGVKEKVDAYLREQESQRVANGDFSGDLSVEELKKNNIIFEITTKEGIKLGIIQDLKALGINSKFGKNGKNANDSWNGKGILELEDVFAVDMGDESIYYINNGKIWTVEGNASKEEIIDKNTDKTGEEPLIEVTPKTIEDLENNNKIIITAKAQEGKTLKSTNSYEYYLSKSENSLVGGSWIKYESGKEQTLEVREGNTNYYVFVRRVIDDKGVFSEKNTVLISGTKFHRYGPYINGNDVITYKIIYNLNGGAASNPGTYARSNPTFKLNNPIKTGYTFIGWTGSNGETPEMEVAIPKGSSGARNYIANYRANTYTVEYDGNGQTGGSTEKSIHTYDIEKPLTENGYVKLGYTFKGWSTSSNGEVVYTNKQLVNKLSEKNNAVVKIYAIWNDETKPEIEVTPENSQVEKNKKVRITAKDEGSGLSEENRYEYQITTSNKTIPTTWETYINKEEITIGTDLTGYYYLWIKEVKDKNKNVSSEGGIKEGAYHVYGTYIFDSEIPTVTFTPNGNSTYAKSQLAKIDVEDNGAGINTSTLKYQWTQSNTKPTEASFTTSFLNNTNINKVEGTGNNWYLWILAKDKLGNTVITRSEAFYLDNTTPTNTAPTGAVTSNTLTATFKQIDNESGINNNSKGYKIKKTGDTVWGEFVADSAAVHIFTGLVKNTSYDIKTKVTDNAGNEKESELTTIKTDELDMPTITATPIIYTNEDVKVVISYPDLSYVSKQYSYDGTNWTNTTGNPTTLTVSQNKTIYARMIDSTNQVSGVATKTITNIDKVAPKIDSLISNNINWTNESLTITGKAVDVAKTDTNGCSGIDAYQFSTNASITNTSEGWTNIPITIEQISQNYTIVANGTYYFYVRDVAGNVAKRSIEVTNIEKLAPTKPTYEAYYSDGSGAYNGEWTSKEVRTKIQSTDTESGVQYIQYSKDKSTWTTFKLSISNGVVKEGTSYYGIEKWDLINRDDIYYFRAIDNSGNTSEISNAYKIKYDLTNPTPPTISTDDNYVKSGLILQYDGRNNTGSGHSINTTTWKDLSGNGNDGTLEGGTWINNALSLDGVDDRVVVPYNNTLAPNEFTIDISINKKAVMKNTRSILFVKWHGYTIELLPNNITVFGVNGVTSYLPSPIAQSLNERYTVTATYKDGKQQLFIDGNLVASGNINGDVTHSSESLTIGSYGKTDYVNGDIYSVRMYNRQLADSEISTNYKVDLANSEQYTSKDTQITISGGSATSGILKHQYSLDNGTTWANYNASSKPIINKEGTTKVTARAVSNSGVNGQTESLNVNIDKTKPTVQIGTNGGTYTIPVGGTTVNASTAVTVSDTGGAGIGLLQYSWSTSNIVEPTSWTNFTNGENITSALSGGNNYLWLNVVDKAGNRADTKVSNVYKVQYQVKYDANGGTGVPAEQAKINGTNLTLSGTIPTRSGYEFLGWGVSNSQTSATYTAGGIYTENTSKILYAIWRKTVTLTFYDYTTSTVTRTATGYMYNAQSSVTITTPAQNASSTWINRGWSTANTGNAGIAVAPGGSIAVSDSASYYGLYEKTVTVTKYVYNNTASTLSGTAYMNASGTIINASINLGTTSLSGYTPRGWSTSNAANAGIAVGLNGTVSANTNETYFMSYNYTVTATYYYNNTSTQPTATAYMNYLGTKIGALPTVPTNPTSSGWAFRGWSTSTAYNGGVATPGVITGDIVYYGSYQKTVTATKYVYNNTASTATGIAYMNYANTIVNASINLGTTSLAGYTPRGWSTSSAANAAITVPVNGNVSIASDTTYFMSYTYTVTITYNANGGSGTPAAQSGTAYMNYANSVINPAITLSTTKPTRSGYTFLGWSTSSAATSATYNAGTAYTFSPNTTLYAVWEDVPVPSGFYHVGGTKAEGFVISDNSLDAEKDVNGNLVGNQYVWIPVDKTTFDKNFKRTEGYESGSLQTYNCGEAGADGVNSTIEESETTKQEAKDMYASVKKNGGFYIARYEAGKETDKVVSKKGVAVWNNIKWGNSMSDETGGAVEKARGLDSQNGYTSVTSTLCYGVQWDAVMNFMDNNYITNEKEGKANCYINSYVRDSTGKGNYDESRTNIWRRSVAPSGAAIEYQVKNIYDMAGNVSEWTMESQTEHSINVRVDRGGNFYYKGTDYPSSNRDVSEPIDSYSSIGFRPTLYL